MKREDWPDTRVIVQVPMNPALANSVDQWAVLQSPPVTREEAVAMLASKALSTAGAH